VTESENQDQQDATPEVAVQERFTRPIDGFIWGTGRRKSSVARVRLKYGGGKITVNGKDYKAFFPTILSQLTVTGPLALTGAQHKFDVAITVNGGGLTGQSGACALGLGRALKELEPSMEHALREAGYLTRDSRMKERKKYGLRGARRAFQFSKR
jgi:small subunit ribosomal protein S9